MIFRQAFRAGDQTTLMDLLTEDARLVAVAQFATGVNLSFLPAGYTVELSEVNYQPAVIVRASGRALVVFTIEVEDQRVKTVRFMANPEKLGHI